MKKIIIIVTAVVLVLGLSITTALAAATDGFKTKIKVNKDEAEQWVAEQDQKKRELYAGSIVEVSPDKNLLESAYEKADASQREQLDNIVKVEEFGAVGIYNKQVLIIMNQLPKDVANITLEEVKNICAKTDRNSFESADELEKYLANEFDKIAGAPDFAGGSGISRSIYFINDEHTAYVRIMNGHVTYFSEFGQSGEKLF